MSSRSALIREIQQLLSGEHADPRAAQGLFLIPLLVETLLHFVIATPFDIYFLIGSVIVVIPTLGSVAIGKGLLSDRLTIWIPILDIVALGAYRLSESTAVGIAVAFPAIWLGLQFGRKGVAITLVTVLAVVVVPTLVTVGDAQEAYSRTIQLTLMAVICSGVVAMTAELWKAQVEETSSSAARLEHAMDDAIEQRRLTRTIVNGVDVGLVAIDAQGAYDSMNPRHEEFLKLAYPSGHGGRAGQVGFAYAADGVTTLAHDDMPTVRAIRGEAFRDLLIWVGEDPAERRALAVSSTPYFRTNGDFGGAVLAYHDITELVLASRIKEEFVASVSHELRTPLTSIIGYVDIMLDEADRLPSDVYDHLVTVQRNARRLHRLVDDLLSTALQSVTTVLDVSRVPVVVLLRRSALEASRAAASAGLSFEFDVSGAPSDLEIHGDAERLAQVFDNLFSNAVKYTPPGGHVSASVVQHNGQAVIRVRDTGRGISEAELSEIFTKFFRSKTVLIEAIPGIGLGLAITKTIVDAHGGEIDVNSEPGKGSTFEVRLPVAKSSGRGDSRGDSGAPAQVSARAGARVDARAD
jgi:signal transduction histidine kinase